MRSAMMIIPLILFALSTSAHAHTGDRIYPVYEINEESTSIQIDGSVEDWEELFEPSAKALEFGPTTGDTEGPDPSDLDFRIWLGWMQSPSRLYVAYQTIDDVYVNDSSAYDAMFIWFDADHSGGRWGSRGADSEETRLLRNSNAQSYKTMPEANA